MIIRGECDMCLGVVLEKLLVIFKDMRLGNQAVDEYTKQVQQLSKLMSDAVKRNEK